MHGQRLVADNRDGPPQSIDRQAFYEIVDRHSFAVEEQVIAGAILIWPHQEIEQALALWRQQSGPDGKRAGYVLSHQPIHERPHIFPRQAENGAVGKGGSGHGLQLGSAA